MQLQELNESNKKEYNQFVAGQPTGSFLQSWEWGDWQTHLGRTVHRFAFTDRAGLHIAAIQLIRMPLPAGKFYLYAPYGPVTDREFGTEDLQLLISELRKRFASALFLRIEPEKKLAGLERLAKKSTNIQPGITMVVDIAKTSEALLAAMHPKTRYNIKIAQRHGVEIQSELAVTPQHGLYVKEAIDAIVQTQVRQHYKGHNAAYYYGLVDFFAIRHSNSDLKIRIYKALYQKQLVTSGIMVDFGTTRMYLYGGSSEEHKNVMAPYLMHWQCMQDAQALGLKSYDLGGSEVAGGGERGFTRFKRGFGGAVVEYAGAYDIVNKRILYPLYKVGRVINRLKG